MTLIGERFQHGEPAARPGNFRRLGSDEARATSSATAARRAARRRIPAGTAYARAPARRHQRAPRSARHPRRGGTGHATRDEPARAEVLGEFAKIEEAERAAASSVTLLALVNRAQKQIEDAEAKAK